MKDSTGTMKAVSRKHKPHADPENSDFENSDLEMLAVKSVLRLNPFLPRLNV